MDPQDQDQNNQTDSLKQQYQDILNKYSKEIKTQPDPMPQSETETGAPQLPPASSPEPTTQESVLPPLPQTPSENILSEVPPETTENTPILPPEVPTTNGTIDEILNQPPQPPQPPQEYSPEPPPVLPEFTPNIPEPPVESPQLPPPPISPEPPIPPSPSAYPTPEPPQDVNAKLSEILDDKPQKPSGSSKFAKTFFFISLIIFLTVVGAIAYNLIKDQSASTIPSGADKIVVDEDTDSPDVSSPNCVINDKTYSVNQSFTAADGCNTCTCQSDGTIACTEMACELTPSESTSSSLPDTGSEAEETTDE